MSRRRRIPAATETSVLLKSARRCTLCHHLSGDGREKHGQIAHLDGDPANNTEDNLVFMCLEHHSLYDSKTRQHKNYGIAEIKRARARLYRAVRNGKHLGTAEPPSNRVEAQQYPHSDGRSTTEITSDHLVKSRRKSQRAVGTPLPNLKADFNSAPIGPIFLTPEGVWSASYSPSAAKWIGLRMKVCNLPIKGTKIGPAKAVSVRVKFEHDTGLDAASAAPTAWLHEKLGYVNFKPGDEKEAIIAVRSNSDWYTVTNVRDLQGYPPNTSAMHFQPAPWFKGQLHVGLIVKGDVIEEHYSWEVIGQSIVPKIRKLEPSMPEELNVKVVLKQTVLNGSSHPEFLQRVATVYINGREYRVLAPPEAQGDAVDWWPHFSVRQLVDVNTEVEIHDANSALALEAVREELQTQKPKGGEESQSATESADREFARLAIEEARKSVSEGDGRSHPLVGAVVVKDGKVLALSHRGETEGNHAEYNALERKLADATLVGATVYTTLEPCTTRKHPKIPCADRLIERKVARVVIGMLDPNPEITGRGVLKLRGANIVTELFPHDLMAEVEELNRDFTRAFERGATKPPIVDKWVSIGYEHNSGIAKKLNDEGFDLGWVSANREVEKVEFGGWEYVLLDLEDGNKARLKIHDSPAIGGHLVLLRKRRS
jgi:pyrimidine deaminase RibD-like protein